MKDIQEKKRYVGLDIFRVISCVMICAFHTVIHLGCDYGFLQPVILMGAVFMTAFFMLSGFSLYLSYCGNNLSDIKNMRFFLRRRLIGIIPLYYIVAFSFVLISRTETLFENLALVPVEMLGIQSMFPDLSSVTHNGSSWFISCIILCYLLYPYLQEVIKQLTKRGKMLLIVICGSVLLWAPFVVMLFGTGSIYSNPFFRFLEFSIGIALSALCVEWCHNKQPIHSSKNWILFILEVLVYFLGVSHAVKLEIGVGNYMLYSWIGLPMFALMLLTLFGVKSSLLGKSKLLRYMSSISYAVYLSQFFSNWICKMIIAKYGIVSNVIKIALGWSVCIIIAIVLHEVIEKRIILVLRARLSVD